MGGQEARRGHEHQVPSLGGPELAVLLDGGFEHLKRVRE